MTRFHVPLCDQTHNDVAAEMHKGIVENGPQPAARDRACNGDIRHHRGPVEIVVERPRDQFAMPFQANTGCAVTIDHGPLLLEPVADAMRFCGDSDRGFSGTHRHRCILYGQPAVGGMSGKTYGTYCTLLGLLSSLDALTWFVEHGGPHPLYGQDIRRDLDLACNPATLPF